MKTTNRRNSKKSEALITQALLGKEPTFSNESLTVAEFTSAINWYNSSYGRGEAKRFLIDYLYAIDRNEDAEILKNVPEAGISTTAGWIARMLTNGATISDDNWKFLEREINASLNYKSSNDGKINQKIGLPKEDISDKIGNIIGGIEELIDAGDSFSTLKYLKMNLVPNYMVNKIIAYYAPIYEEYLDALSRKDEDLIEAYSDIKLVQKNVNVYESIINDLVEYKDYKRAIRKKKKKVK